jgi:hypothetical protein
MEPADMEQLIRATYARWSRGTTASIPRPAAPTGAASIDEFEHPGPGRVPCSAASISGDGDRETRLEVFVNRIADGRAAAAEG